MAKKTIKKYYRRKGRWSANIRNISDSQINIEVGNFYFTTTLTTNPAQSTSTVSQQYTVKNFELSFSLDLNNNATPNLGSNIENIIFYVMYVPQGITVDSNLPIQHPEWIMTYKFMGSIDMEVENNNQIGLSYIAPRRGPYKIKTRMARRLQTGDSVVLLITGVNKNNGSVSGDMSGLLRWWTKAN